MNDTGGLSYKFYFFFIRKSFLFVILLFFFFFFFFLKNFFCESIKEKQSTMEKKMRKKKKRKNKNKIKILGKGRRKKKEKKNDSLLFFSPPFFPSCERHKAFAATSLTYRFFRKISHKRDCKQNTALRNSCPSGTIIQCS